MQPKSHEELVELQWQADTKLLADAITALPRNDPNRAILQADYERRFVEKFGNAVPLATGGIHIDTRNKVVHHTRSYVGGQQGGWRTEPLPDPKKEGSK